MGPEKLGNIKCWQLSEDGKISPSRKCPCVKCRSLGKSRSLEKQQTSLGIMGAQLTAPLKPRGQSQHYRIEEFKGGS